MKIIIIQVLFFLSSISKIFSRLKCASSLSGGLTDSCYAVDINNNNIKYVSKCKKGKICMTQEELSDTRSINDLKLFQDGFSNLNLGQCVPFPMPLFVDDACTVNEECASKNCDGGKCKEPEFCNNDLQCDYGKYCDMHNNIDKEKNEYKCKEFKNENDKCYDNNECGRFMLCNFGEYNSEGICKKIGSISNGEKVSDDMLCKTGFRDDNKECHEITENTICKNNQSNYNLENNKNETKICKNNEIDDSYYPINSRNKIEAFYDYKSKLDEEFDEMENDDKMWNWNNNRLHGDKKELKLKYFFYKHPEYYGKYHKYDDEIDCIVDYLRQKELNSSINKMSKLLLLTFLLFLI